MPNHALNSDREVVQGSHYAGAFLIPPVLLVVLIRLEYTNVFAYNT